MWYVLPDITWALLYQVTMRTSEYLVLCGTSDHLSVIRRLCVRHQPRACTLATRLLLLFTAWNIGQHV
jgi:hypothetical protein